MRREGERTWDKGTERKEREWAQVIRMLEREVGSGERIWYNILRRCDLTRHSYCHKTILPFNLYRLISPIPFHSLRSITISILTYLWRLICQTLSLSSSFIYLFSFSFFLLVNHVSLLLFIHVNLLLSCIHKFTSLSPVC